MQTAFDSMPHELIWDSMLARGVSTQVAALHLRELSGMDTYMTLPIAGRTAAFLLTKGGKQGGIETPDEWLMLVDHIVRTVVSQWNSADLVFKLVGDDGVSIPLMNHAVWADNIFLFASGMKEMQGMITDLDRLLSIVCRAGKGTSTENPHL